MKVRIECTGLDTNRVETTSMQSQTLHCLHVSFLWEILFFSLTNMMLLQGFFGLLFIQACLLIIVPGTEADGRYFLIFNSVNVYYFYVYRYIS